MLFLCAWEFQSSRPEPHPRQTGTRASCRRPRRSSRCGRVTAPRASLRDVARTRLPPSRTVPRKPPNHWSMALRRNKEWKPLRSPSRFVGVSAGARYCPPARRARRLAPDRHLSLPAHGARHQSQSAIYTAPHLASELSSNRPSRPL